MRRIGPWGTAARVVAGAAMVAGAAVLGIDVLEAALGLVVFPLVVTVVLALRGWSAPSVRLTGPEGHCLNCAIGVAALLAVPVPALLFYGTSMLLAALRGYAGCELFAVSNWLRRGDDQIACPLFHPVDVAESRAAPRTTSR